MERAGELQPVIAALRVLYCCAVRYESPAPEDLLLVQMFGPWDDLERPVDEQACEIVSAFLVSVRRRQPQDIGTGGRYPVRVRALNP